MKILCTIIFVTFLPNLAFSETNSKLKAVRASDCSYVFTHVAVNLRKQSGQSKEADTYYQTAGALSKAVDGFGGNFKELLLGSLVRYQDFLEDEEFLISEIGYCEGFINANTNAINSFEPRHPISPNISFSRDALKRAR